MQKSFSCDGASTGVVPVSVGQNLASQNFAQGKHTVNDFIIFNFPCTNAAAGFAKQRAIAEARTRPRDDGLSPQRVAARFRFSLRCKLQAAIMRGNGLLAAEVGL